MYKIYYIILLTGNAPQEMLLENPRMIRLIKPLTTNLAAMKPVAGIYDGFSIGNLELISSVQ